jgi:hypothetical protein
MMVEGDVGEEVRGESVVANSHGGPTAFSASPFCSSAFFSTSSLAVTLSPLLITSASLAAVLVGSGALATGFGVLMAVGVYGVEVMKIEGLIRGWRRGWWLVRRSWGSGNGG